MAAVIATGTTDATSADIVVASGATATLSLFYAVPTTPPTNAVAAIDVKGSNGEYFEIGRLTMHNPIKVIDGPGTYRARRSANQNVGAQSFGVDQS